MYLIYQPGIANKSVRDHPNDQEQPVRGADPGSLLVPGSPVGYDGANGWWLLDSYARFESLRQDHVLGAVLQVQPLLGAEGLA